MIPTADELAAWRTLADAASEGPWRTEEWDDETLAIRSRAVLPLAYLSDRDIFDAEFIAASRTAVPRLLDAVEQLTADQDALGEALGWALLYLRTATDAYNEEPENMQKASDVFSAWFNARRVLLGGASDG